MTDNHSGVRASVIRALAKISLLASVGLLALLFVGTASLRPASPLTGIGEANPLGVLVIGTLFVAGLVVLLLGAFHAPSAGRSRTTDHAPRHYDSPHPLT